MFEVNGIAYASEKSNKISITDAKVTDHLMMIVTFSGGEKRVFDASVLTGSAFKPLEDDAIFSNFKIMHGVITWMNDEISMSIASNMRIILLLLPCKLRYFTCHMRKREYRYSLFLIFIYSRNTGLIGSEISSGISSTSKNLSSSTSSSWRFMVP